MSDLTRLMVSANKVIELSQTTNWVEPILLADEPRRGPSRDHHSNLTPWRSREWVRPPRPFPPSPPSPAPEPALATAEHARRAAAARAARPALRWCAL